MTIRWSLSFISNAVMAGYFVQITRFWRKTIEQTRNKKRQNSHKPFCRFFKYFIHY